MGKKIDPEFECPAGLKIDPKYARRLLKGQKQKEPKQFRGFLHNASKVKETHGIINPDWVQRWVKSGKINPRCKSISDIEGDCRELIAKAGAYEIFGRPIFLAADGNYYTVTLQPKIAPAEIKDIKEALRKEK